MIVLDTSDNIVNTDVTEPIVIGMEAPPVIQ